MIKQLLPYEKEVLSDWLNVNGLHPQINCKEGYKMDISDFTKQQGEFLKADVIKDATVAKITDEAQIVHNEKFDTDRLHIPVNIDGKEFIFDASRTNSRTIQEVLGTDTAKWVGKEIVLETYKTKTSEGKMTLALNVKEVRV